MMMPASQAATRSPPILGRMAMTSPATISTTPTAPGVGDRQVGVAVIHVEGEPVLDPDHALHAMDGADQGRDEPAPFDPALQDDHAVDDVDEEPAGVQHEVADDDVVHDLAPDD